jgi:capsular polysaccharide transport system permease protein
MIAEAVRTQGRVLLALILREARARYGKTQAGYLWALLEPLVHLVGLMIIFTAVRVRVSPLDGGLPIFLATGLATYFGFRNVMKRTSIGYDSGEALLSFPIVKILDVFFAKALLELAAWVTVSFLLIGGLIITGNAMLPESILEMLAAIGLLFMVAFGFGTTLGIASQFIPSLRAFLRFPLRLLYFASGVFYLPDILPPAARDILWWNPVLHGIAMFREGYYATYESTILDKEYLGGWAIAMVLLALALERAARKPLRSLP